MKQMENKLSAEGLLVHMKECIQNVIKHTTGYYSEC